MNRLCVIFLIISSLVSVFFCGKAIVGVYGYFSLDSQANAQVEKWKIIEKTESAFAIEAEYRFFLQEKEISGQTEFAKPYFLNPYAAQRAIDQLASTRWIVFFNAKNPQKNSLQRVFPFQLCIQAFLTLGLIAYFFILKKWWLKRFA